MAMRARKRAGRQPLRGWIKWVFFLSFPFTVISAEAFFRIERVNNDYEVNRLNAELEQAQHSIDELETRRATFDNLDFLDARAQELGFVKPTPGQVETVAASGDAPRALPSLDFDFLGLDAPATPVRP
jgi:hypothetical protein